VQPLTVADLGERALIERIRARLTPAPWIIVGPGDDAAVLAPERGAHEVITTDALVETVHFDCRFVPPEAIGSRALAVNLSDLAAMGALPRAALLSLILPDRFAVEALDRLVDGFLAMAGRHRVSLVGGNITRSPGPLVVDVTALGSVRPRRALRREGARPGDLVYVTGTLGDAAVGLLHLQAAAQADVGVPPGAATAGAGVLQGGHAELAWDVERCAERYLRPEPRVRAGVLLGRGRAAASCVDLSDGLADGVAQIAAASSVGVEIDVETLPISAAVRHFYTALGRDPIEAVLRGGDDYELVFTVRPAHRGRLRGVRQRLGDLPITRIGVVTAERKLLLTSAHGTRELPPGFEHFR
jgi:thiamine-monophosphate kinase